MIGLIGKKLGMTQIFTEQGTQVPCTVVEAPPNPVVKVIANEVKKPGYVAIELGYGEQRVRRASSGKKGKKGSDRTPRGRRAPNAVVKHAAKAGLEVPPSAFRSFRLDDMPKRGETPSYKAGD